MAKISYKERAKLPKKDFAIPSKKTKDNKAGKGAYPIEDKAHARAALSRVSANGTSAEKADVRRKVHAKYPEIGKTKTSHRKGVSVETLRS